MSEVLSGPATRSDRFTIFPADERQSLRLGRFLMAWRAAVEGTSPWARIAPR